VGMSAVDRVDLRRVDVDAGRAEAGARELERERKADVAEPDDAAAGFAAPEFDSLLISPPRRDGARFRPSRAPPAQTTRPPGCATERSRRGARDTGLRSTWPSRRRRRRWR